MNMQRNGPNGTRLRNPAAGKDPHPDLDPDIEDDTDQDVDFADSGDVDEGTSNIGEASVEIDVDELIEELEADRNGVPASNGPSSRKRLEDVLEERRIAHELDEIDEFEAPHHD